MSTNCVLNGGTIYSTYYLGVNTTLIANGSSSILNISSDQFFFETVLNGSNISSMTGTVYLQFSPGDYIEPYIRYTSQQLVL